MTVRLNVQGRMHEFFGLGTTHFTEVDEDTGAKEVIKLRVHSLLIKLHNGKAVVYWKKFMRDDTWLPEDGVGWPVFKKRFNVSLSLDTLEAMPTKPIAGPVEVEKRVKVGSCTNVPLELLQTLHPTRAKTCQQSVDIRCNVCSVSVLVFAGNVSVHGFYLVNILTFLFEFAGLHQTLAIMVGGKPSTQQGASMS